MCYKGKLNPLTVKYSNVTNEILNNLLPSYSQVSVKVHTVSY